MTSSALSSRIPEVTELLNSRPLIRVVNFHNTPRAKADQFDRELANYASSFSSVNQDELDDYLTTGHWHKPKPGLIVVAYEGYRNGYDVLAPLIERHGFIGWYFIITGFIKAPIEEQITYARGHHIGMKTREYADGRYALTWDEIKRLETKHVIASHARSHSELSKLDESVVEREVVGSQEDFVEHLGHPVRAFASLTGPEHGIHPIQDRLVVSAGYDFVFSNFRIQRIAAGKKHAS